MNPKSFLIVFIILSVISISYAGRHGKKNKSGKKGVKKCFREMLGKCMKSDGGVVAPELSMKLIDKFHQDCQTELTNSSSTSDTTEKKSDKKKRKAKNKMCMKACTLKKLVFPDSSPQKEAFENFAKNLTDAAQETYLKQLNACFVAKSVTLENLTMEDKCKSWKIPAKCFKKSLKVACRMPSETTDATSSADEASSPASVPDDNKDSNDANDEDDNNDDDTDDDKENVTEE